MAENNLDGAVEIPAMTLNEDWVPAINAMESFDIKESVNVVFAHVTELDEIIQKTAPFKLVKTDKDAGVAIIKDLVIKLHNIAMMLAPIIPETSKKIIDIVASNKKPETPLFLRKD
jgi:methionyl-tRNA synthetase